MKIAQVVINVAKHHENVEFLYLSKDGSECTLQVSKKHPVKMSRADVLKGEVKADPVDDVNKPATAKDLIAQIEVAETIENVDKIVGEDKRATVIAAADKRKEELKPVDQV